MSFIGRVQQGSYEEFLRAKNFIDNGKYVVLIKNRNDSGYQVKKGYKYSGWAKIVNYFTKNGVFIGNSKERLAAFAIDDLEARVKLLQVGSPDDLDGFEEEMEKIQELSQSTLSPSLKKKKAIAARLDSFNKRLRSSKLDEIADLQKEIIAFFKDNKQHIDPDTIAIFTKSLESKLQYAVKYELEGFNKEFAKLEGSSFTLAQRLKNFSERLNAFFGRPEAKKYISDETKIELFRKLESKIEDVVKDILEEFKIEFSKLEESPLTVMHEWQKFSKQLNAFFDRPEAKKYIPEETRIELVRKVNEALEKENRLMPQEEELAEIREAHFSDYEISPEEIQRRQQEEEDRRAQEEKERKAFANRSERGVLQSEISKFQEEARSSVLDRRPIPEKPIQTRELLRQGQNSRKEPGSLGAEKDKDDLSDLISRAKAAYSLEEYQMLLAQKKFLKVGKDSQELDQTLKALSTRITKAKKQSLIDQLDKITGNLNRAKHKLSGIQRELSRTTGIKEQLARVETNIKKQKEENKRQIKQLRKQLEAISDNIRTFIIERNEKLKEGLIKTKESLIEEIRDLNQDGIVKKLIADKQVLEERLKALPKLQKAERETFEAITKLERLQKDGLALQSRLDSTLSTSETLPDVEQIAPILSEIEKFASQTGGI